MNSYFKPVGFGDVKEIKNKQSQSLRRSPSDRDGGGDTNLEFEIPYTQY